MANQTRAKLDGAVFIEHAFGLARALEVKTLLVLANKGPLTDLVEKHRQDEAVLWVAGGGIGKVSRRDQDPVVEIPTSRLTRMSQMRIGLYVATLDGKVDLDDRVMCLSGVAGSRTLDTLMVTKPKVDFPWLGAEGLERTRKLVAPREFGRLLELCLRFAKEGREGKSIGTAFVVGEADQLAPYLRQLILNPCAGHSSRARSIHNEDFAETLRELSALDGAMVVDKKGIVQSAGTYLDAPTKKAKLRQGWGARHAAAASITSVTDALSMVVSESSGTVTVFDDGRPVLELEKPS